MREELRMSTLPYENSITCMSCEKWHELKTVRGFPYINKRTHTFLLKTAPMLFGIRRLCTLPYVDFLFCRDSTRLISPFLSGAVLSQTQLEVNPLWSEAMTSDQISSAEQWGAYAPVSLFTIISCLVYCEECFFEDVRKYFFLPPHLPGWVWQAWFSS